MPAFVSKTGTNTQKTNIIKSFVLILKLSKKFIILIIPQKNKPILKNRLSSKIIILILQHFCTKCLSFFAKKSLNFAL
jgi:hypothetical protein